MLQSLRWRNVGPFRGGRTRAVAGVPSRPNIFYIGVVNGGVWETTDFGRTWAPIFDREPTGSIGAVAVAASDPNVIYVGSGEGLHRPDLSVGDGIYKSTDAGKTWAHLGLRDGQQIRQIAIDPHDPNRLFVAVAGHPYGPNPERGLFRSTDGGQTFEKVLYKDENTGASDVLLDPSNPDVVYASLWEAREGPWENGEWEAPGGGILKSTDGGRTWRQLKNGLPQGLVQANLAIAASNPKRLYATASTTHDVGIFVSIYRSDDAGESWQKVTDDTRPATRIGGGDLPVVGVDPKNADIVYSTSIVAWKSTDGGKTWAALRGAPGGDDYQNIWTNPNNPDIILLASDQGAVITVNGGHTWSSWYNQSTAQLYHVSADNAFPYRLCSGQQESGSVCISSRGNDGEVTFREWHPVGAEEYGYVMPDPSDPDIVYGGKLTRYDRRTGQAQNILPKPFRSQTFRMLRTEPVIFSPANPHVLYFAANTLWKTSDGGKNWQQISPDLTRKTFEVPANVGKYRSLDSAQPKQRGVIYAVAPSPTEARTVSQTTAAGGSQLIWAGTDDGLIHITQDGGAHWANVTPPQLVPFAKVSIIEASHFDKGTAYAAINTLRLDDLRPHILRTRDFGKTWTDIVNGIPANENVNAVREDPQRKGLLFAGTERAVYVSFDDGDHWQSLRLNMPASSVRDLAIKNADLIAATHGRGFWILDDISPLRQMNTSAMSADAFLFQPTQAYRVRWNMNTDTPLPPDVPAGENPPDGAVIDYYLKDTASGPVTLEIKDSSGQVMRRYSSADPVPPPDPKLTIPEYWLRPAKPLSSAAGVHRFLWDMHLPPVPGIKPEYPISAVYRNTTPSPTSPWVLPGKYTVTLSANGKSYTQPLTVTMDPRVKTPVADLARQFELSRQLYQDLVALAPAAAQAEAVHEQLTEVRKKSTGQPIASDLDAFEKKLTSVEGSEDSRPGADGVPETIVGLRTSLLGLLSVLQDADVAPTSQAATSVGQLHGAVQPLVQKWQAFKQRELPEMNERLKKANLGEFNLTPAK